MKNVLKSLTLMALVLAIALPLAAADKEKKKKKKGKGRSPSAALLKRVEDAGVEGEALKKIQTIAKEYDAKITEARKGLGDGNRKLAAARKKAQDEGKKGKELREAIAAVELTDEQTAAQKELRKLQLELNGKIAALLTPEQREKAKIRVPKAKKKKKKDAA